MLCLSISAGSFLHADQPWFHSRGVILSYYSFERAVCEIGAVMLGVHHTVTGKIRDPETFLPLLQASQLPAISILWPAIGPSHHYQEHARTQLTVASSSQQQASSQLHTVWNTKIA